VFIIVVYGAGWMAFPDRSDLINTGYRS